MSAGLTGCLGTAPRSPPPTPTIDCERASRPAPEAGPKDEIEPRSYPEPPKGEVDVEWVTDHEEAYRRNSLLAEYNIADWYTFRVRQSERERHSKGVLVRLTYHYSYETIDGAIADSPIQTAAYYVDDRGARRAHSSGGPELDADLDPTTDGQTVVCF